MLLPKQLQLYGKRTPSGCLEYKERLDENGYGIIFYRHKQRNTHRVAAFCYGIISSLDSPFKILHKCDNPCCFEETHLEKGFDSKNQKDAWNRGRRIYKKPKRCKYGHLLEGDNLRLYKGRRQCIACKRRDSYLHNIITRGH